MTNFPSIAIIWFYIFSSHTHYALFPLQPHPKMFWWTRGFCQSKGTFDSPRPHAWGGHIWRPAVNISCLSSLFSYNIFWDRFSYWSWNLLSCGPQWFSCLARAQIVGTYYYVWLLQKCWGIPFGFICPYSKHLTEPSSFRDCLLQVCSACPLILFISQLGIEIPPDILKLFPGTRIQSCTYLRFCRNIESRD